jgi:hypothetical protein
MVRLDYSTKNIIVSTDHEIHLIAGEIIQQTIKPSNNINKFNFIYPLHGVYFATGKDGTLYWSNNINFQNFIEIPVFMNQ